MRMLTIAIPKGRVLKALSPLLARMGIAPTALLDTPSDETRGGPDRRLLREFPEANLRVLLLKPDDVPTYVEYGAADAGVCGRDVLVERAFDLYEPVNLHIGRCHMAVAGKPGTVGGLGLRPRIATKYPRIASAHFARRGIQAEIIFVQGSVELAPITGLADAIVDVVESGETLRANGLVELEHVMDISSVLVVNRAAFKLLGARTTELIEAFRGAASPT